MSREGTSRRTARSSSRRTRSPISPPARPRCAGDVAPRFDRLAVDEVDDLRKGVEGLEAALAPEGAGPESLEVEGGLAEILAEAERSLTVARSGVLVPSLQLAILAAYALLFTAFLMAEERRLETALLQARGADSRRVALAALVEGLLVALPAALAGPWLAALSLRLLNRFGPLAEIDLSLDPHVGREAYILAAVAALASVAALVVPALRSQRVALAVAQLGRPPEKGFVERARLDLVLLALALLAYWQLRRYGGTLIEDAQGKLGIDPFLIAAPALGLLAGAVLALRVVPAVAILAERLGSSARGVVAPLGTRQLSRRPRTYARAALLLTLALAIGLFAAAFGSTWTRSQQDQADHEAGADVRVKPDERSGALPRLALPRAYEGLPGVQAVVPGLTEPFDLPDAAAGALVVIDAERAPEVVSLREDLADEPADELFRPLAARRTELPALRLPAETRELALTVRGDLDPRAQRFGFFGAVPGLGNVGVFPPTLALVVRDAAGVLHWYRAGELTKPDQERRFVVDLAVGGAQGEDVEPAYPLELVSIELGVVAPFLVPNQGELEVLALDARSEGGAWAPVDLEAPSWSVLEPQLAAAQTAPEGQIAEGPGAPLTLRLATGSSDQDEVEVAFRLMPGDIPRRAGRCRLSRPGRSSRRRARAPGEVVPLELAGARRRVEIVSALEGFPTVPPDGAALVVDYGSYSALSYLADGTIVEPARVVDRDCARAGGGRRRPFRRRALLERRAWRAARRCQKRCRTIQSPSGRSGRFRSGSSPRPSSPTVGFAVSAAVSARERTTEFAVMRSLGLSSRQLSGWLVVENGVLVLVSLAAGTLLGLLLARFVLPAVSLTQSGEETFPQP